MDSWEREEWRSANTRMRHQVDSILQTLAEQRAKLAGTQEQMRKEGVQASSGDRQVDVTVDADGIITKVRLAPGALRRSPDQLGRLVADVAREAALAARRRQTEMVALAAEEVGAVPDLPDLIAGAPSLHNPAAHTSDTDSDGRRTPGVPR